jgi:hypothetical protein
MHFFDHYEKDDKEVKFLNDVAPSGLGFGGTMGKNFRLWIDYQDM